MSEAEFDAWQRDLAREYADDQVAAGNWDPVTAMDRAAAENARFLPNGLATPRMLFVRAVLIGGEPVGRAWLGLDHPRGAPGTAFLYDIAIDEPHRGKGFGTAFLAELERLVIENGVSALELNVFGDNEPALALYRHSGYGVVTQQLRKRLGD
jgi:ribosomal protein S18 acetylase RimI-like enzyme